SAGGTRRLMRGLINYASDSSGRIPLSRGEGMRVRDLPGGLVITLTPLPLLFPPGVRNFGAPARRRRCPPDIGDFPVSPPSRGEGELASNLIGTESVH